MARMEHQPKEVSVWMVRYQVGVPEVRYKEGESNTWPQEDLHRLMTCAKKV